MENVILWDKNLIQKNMFYREETVKHVLWVSKTNDSENDLYPRLLMW